MCRMDWQRMLWTETHLSVSVCAQPPSALWDGSRHSSALLEGQLSSKFLLLIMIKKRLCEKESQGKERNKEGPPLVFLINRCPGSQRCQRLSKPPSRSASSMFSYSFSYTAQTWAGKSHSFTLGESPYALSNYQQIKF